MIITSPNNRSPPKAASYGVPSSDQTIPQDTTRGQEVEQIHRLKTNRFEFIRFDFLNGPIFEQRMMLLKLIRLLFRCLTPLVRLRTFPAHLSTHPKLAFAQLQMTSTFPEVADDSLPTSFSGRLQNHWFFCLRTLPPISLKARRNVPYERWT